MERSEILNRLKLMIPIRDDEIVNCELFGNKGLLIELTSGFKFIFEFDKENDVNSWSMRKYDGVIQRGGYK